MSKRAKLGEIDAWIAATLAAETDDCIEWPFAENGVTGYGNLKRGGRWRAAHNYVCELAHGPAPTTPKHEAAHAPVVCHSRKCCNKRHLRWATVKENHQDRIADGTSSRAVKLTEADVREIRRLASTLTCQEIARLYPVTANHVWRVVKRRLWASLP